jgi:hypothetical protein
MNIDSISQRLLALGMTSLGLGLGLIVTAFVGENTPVMGLWGSIIFGIGASFTASYYLTRSRHSDQ